MASGKKPAESNAKKLSEKVSEKVEVAKTEMEMGIGHVEGVE